LCHDVTKMFRLQYISDIHLERMVRPLFHQIVRPNAGTLVLAGDISHPQRVLYPKFIEYCKKNWDTVIVVPGNHELEHGYGQQLKLCKQICAQWNSVHFLQNESVYLKDLRVNFCGTTLWTPKVKPTLHKEAIAWLDSALYNATILEANTVVVTHHMPSKLISHRRYASYKNIDNFTNNLDEMISWPVRAWISGHSHHQKEVRLQFDDPPTEEGEIILGVNAYQGGGSPDQTMEFTLIPPSVPSMVLA
jgi:3',5'-cyclic AMP phosphodiesterase CpdA